MPEETSQTIQAIITAADAAKKAAEVAAEAVRIAAQVATEASRVASLSSIESAKVSENITFIKSELSDIKVKLDSKYVTIDSFTPVRNIAYGLMAVMGVATVGAILKLIFIK